MTALLLAAALALCATPPASAAVDPAPPPPAAPPALWIAESAPSHVQFVLHTFWHDVTGTTRAVTGGLRSASGDPRADGAVALSVDAATIVTGIGRRDRKMREEHLEVAKYPTLEFRSIGPPRRAGDPAADGGARLSVDGDLTIHGVTHRVAVDVLSRSAGPAWIMSGSVAIKLSEFGVPDPSVALNHAQDGVDLSFEIHFRKEGGP
ncbi:MAG: YceI family protein [Acidobacteria bacterium]|nr:YceI family protein [Acidobacteriota bacterium]